MDSDRPVVDPESDGTGATAQGLRSDPKCVGPGATAYGVEPASGRPGAQFSGKEPPRTDSDPTEADPVHGGPGATEDEGGEASGRDEWWGPRGHRSGKAIGKTKML